MLITIPFVSEVFDETASGKPIWEINSDKAWVDELCSEVKIQQIDYSPSPLKQISVRYLLKN